MRKPGNPGQEVLMMKAYKIQSGRQYFISLDYELARRTAEEMSWGEDKLQLEEVDLPDEIATALANSPLNGQYEKSFEEEYQLVLAYPWKG